MCRISENHEVTIPEAVLRDVGLATGDEVEIRCLGRGRIEIVGTRALISKYAGRLTEREYPAGYLDETRRGWE